MLQLSRLLTRRCFNCYSKQIKLKSLSTLTLKYSQDAIFKNHIIRPIIPYVQHRVISNVKQPEKPTQPQPSKPQLNNEEQLTFDEELARLSFFQRYKKLLKEFWYVLIPVHCVTSTFWFGSAFLLAKSGIKIDLDTILNALPLPQSLESTLRNPNLGALALALALYKLATPFRYMSTVYIAVPTIKTLVRKGIIKPIPKLTSSSRIQREISRIRNRVVRKRGSGPR